MLQDSQLALERADSRAAAASRELETVRRDWEGRLEDREVEFRTTVARYSYSQNHINVKVKLARESTTKIETHLFLKIIFLPIVF